MATLFVALQCVQCSTMQVKQQKKSSNKWVCGVCNQRQSVCRVHARGYQAADLRHFVQAANLSRGRGASEPEEAWGLAGEQRVGLVREKRRMDWSEYLDDPGVRDDCGGVVSGAGDGGLEIEVTTELPQKRPRVASSKRSSKAQLGMADKRPKPPSKPGSPKRQHTEWGSSSFPATMTAEVQRSKWSKYLDVVICGESGGSASSGQNWAAFDEQVSTEVVVDDEVHPDFI